MGKRINTAVWSDKYKRWQINVQKDGVRRSFYSSTPGRTGQREANNKADAWLDDGISSSKIKVGDLLDEYLEVIESTTSKSNLKKERYHVENFIRPKIGHKRIDNLTEQDCQNILNSAYRKTNPKTGESSERSKKTLTNIRATINAFLKFCRRKKVTVLRPEELIIPKGARYKGTRILQPKDLITLFSSTESRQRGKMQFDDYIYAYRFAVLTGLRPGELRGLQWADIEGNLVTIRRSVNDLNEITQGKNQNALRSFVLSSMAKDTLNSQRLLQQDANIVFPIQSTSTFRHRWTRYCESNGIEPVSLYALRHTFVSVVKTLPEGEVKSLVGHSQSMDTFGIYGHELSGDSQRSSDHVSALFAKILKGVV